MSENDLLRNAVACFYKRVRIRKPDSFPILRNDNEKGSDFGALLV